MKSLSLNAFFLLKGLPRTGFVRNRYDVSLHFWKGLVVTKNDSCLDTSQHSGIFPRNRPQNRPRGRLPPGLRVVPPVGIRDFPGPPGGQTRLRFVLPFLRPDLGHPILPRPPVPPGVWPGTGPRLVPILFQSTR